MAFTPTISKANPFNGPQLEWIKFLINDIYSMADIVNNPEFDDGISVRSSGVDETGTRSGYFGFGNLSAGATIIGVDVDSSIYPPTGTAGSTNMYGVNSYMLSNSNKTNLVAGRFTIDAAGDTITNAIGVHIPAMNNLSGVSNAYAHLIVSPAGAVSNYGLYETASADSVNFLGSKTSIGGGATAGDFLTVRGDSAQAYASGTAARVMGIRSTTLPTAATASIIGLETLLGFNHAVTAFTSLSAGNITGTGTIDSCYAITASGNQGARTITNHTGVYISTPTAGTITNTYGLYITELTTGSNRYPIWQNGATGTNLFNASQSLFNVGAVGAPGIAFNTDEDTGIYRPSANTLTLVANGVGQFQVNTAGAQLINGVLQLPDDGGPSVPTIRWEHASNTGIWSNQATNDVRICQNGVDKLTVGTSTTSISNNLSVVGDILGNGQTTARVASGVTASIQNEANSTFDGALLTVNANDATTGPLLMLGRSRGTASGSFTALQTNDRIGQIIAVGATGSALSPAASIEFYAEDTFAAGDTPGRIEFKASYDGFSAPTLRMMLNEQGSVNYGYSLFNGQTATRTASGVTPRVQMESNSTFDGYMTVVNANDATSCSMVMLGRSRGTVNGSNTVLQSGDRIGAMWGVGADGDSMNLAAGIEFYADGTYGNGDTPGRIVLYTAPDGSSTLAERMRITQAGVVTFPSVVTTASAANAYLDNGANNSLLRSTSSIKYKKDVEDLDHNLALKVLDLRPVWYRSKSTADKAEWSHYGLIAEEVAQIEPRLVHYAYPEEAYEEVVREDESGTKHSEKVLKEGSEKVPDGVQYERLTVLLLDVIKDLNKRIEVLEGKSPEPEKVAVPETPVVEEVPVVEPVIEPEPEIIVEPEPEPEPTVEPVVEPEPEV
jgi:hypothetical protein